MNQKLLLQLNQDLQKQPDPFCNLEEVAKLYQLTCLLDENISNIEVPDSATPEYIEEILSGYLRDRNIERSESQCKVTLYPDTELEGADLVPLEHLDNQYAFDLLVALVALYSTASINTIYLTEHMADYQVDWLENDIDESEDIEEHETGKAILDSANEILKTKTALSINYHWGIPIVDQICSVRRQLSLHKKEVPAFLEVYISDALDTFEKCMSKRFIKLAGSNDHHESLSPLYYNVFYLYPENPENPDAHEHLIASIDESLNSELQEYSGALDVHQEQYNDISFLVDVVNEYKDVVANFNHIIEAL